MSAISQLSRASCEEKRLHSRHNHQRTILSPDRCLELLDLMQWLIMMHQRAFSEGRNYLEEVQAGLRVQVRFEFSSDMWNSPGSRCEKET